MTAAPFTYPPLVRDPWWYYAQRCAAALATGVVPPAAAFYGPVLDHDEQARLCTTANVSRLLAGDGSCQHTSLLFLGSPRLTLGVLAAQGFINHRRRRQARYDAIPGWRDHRLADVVITDQRIMSSAADGTLMDFYFDHVTEFYPDLSSRSVVFAFGLECSPLRIAGPAAPAIALWTAVGIYGHRWTQDPRLHPLLTAPHQQVGAITNQGSGAISDLADGLSSISVRGRVVGLRVYERDGFT